MSARLFDDVLKDATVQGVHAQTALGNDTATEEQDRKRRRSDAIDTLPNVDAETDIVSAEKRFAKASVVKVDSELGLVFGFAVLCKINGQDYFDLQGDHIPETAMLKAAADFMLNSRLSGDMHERPDGTIVFAFPLTTDIAKALDLGTKQTGLLIAMKPSADVLGKFKSGAYTGFSIGGCYGSVVEID